MVDGFSLFTWSPFREPRVITIYQASTVKRAPEGSNPAPYYSMDGMVCAAARPIFNGAPLVGGHGWKVFKFQSATLRDANTFPRTRSILTTTSLYQGAVSYPIQVTRPRGSPNSGS